MRSLASTGLVSRSTAPPFMAWTLFGTSTWPVTKTMDIRRPPATNLSCKLSPDRPGIFTSSSKQHGPGCGQHASEALPYGGLVIHDEHQRRGCGHGLFPLTGAQGQREMDGRRCRRLGTWVSLMVQREHRCPEVWAWR